LHSLLVKAAVQQTGPAMGSNEKFCLRWNDFESNISVAFRELREEKDFFDVTLACDDSQVQAHKVILSACSPFFRQILRRNPHQHPLLYLKGVKYKELLSVLNFMYQGEVNVAQEELNSFLAVAEDLRVKGLTQNNSESSDKPVKSESSKSSSSGGGGSSSGASRVREPPDRGDSGPPPPKRSRPAIAPAPSPIQITNNRGGGGGGSHHGSGGGGSRYSNDDDDIQEVVPVKAEPRDPAAPPSVTAMAPVEDTSAAYQDTDQGTAGGQQLALDDQYQDDSYDYGDYGEGYDDGGGMIDPNTGMPIASGADGNKDYLPDEIESKMIYVQEPPDFRGISVHWRSLLDVKGQCLVNLVVLNYCFST